MDFSPDKSGIRLAAAASGPSRCLFVALGKASQISEFADQLSWPISALSLPWSFENQDPSTFDAVLRDLRIQETVSASSRPTIKPNITIQGDVNGRAASNSHRHYRNIRVSCSITTSVRQLDMKILRKGIC